MEIGNKGYISSECIELTQLTNPELDSLTPFLMKMEEFGGKVDFNLFYATMTHKDMKAELNMFQKHYLRESTKSIERRAEQEEFSFHPHLSDKTEEIAASSSKRQGTDLITYLNQTDYMRRESQQQLKKEALDNLELIECTFQPKLMR